MTSGVKFETVPEVRPTWEEFRDFRGYLGKVKHLAKSTGLLKVVPPKEWIPRAQG